MAAEDLARALIRLDNEFVRGEVQRGDFAGFDEFGFELSDEERKLLQEAARSVAREEQVAVTVVGKDSQPDQPGEGGPGRDWGYWPPGAAGAIGYVRERLRDPQVQASFAAWQDIRGDRFP